ncbi:MAG TPA: hypothetical protein VG870_14135 [Chitinophagaceae bacterium]|nr:hypothetical protein [Chitinophagaceae bacterium]
MKGEAQKGRLFFSPAKSILFEIGIVQFAMQPLQKMHWFNQTAGMEILTLENICQ